MGMPKKADFCILIGEAGGGLQLVEHVAPAFRFIQRGVNNRKVGYQSKVFQVPEPLTIIFGQLFLGPFNGGFGMGIEPLEIPLHGAVFVVVAFDARHAHFPDDVQTFLGIGVVSDHIAQAGIVSTLIFLSILQNRLECF